MDDMISHHRSEPGPEGRRVMWLGLVAVAVLFLCAVMFVSQKPDKATMAGIPKVKVQTLSTTDANINAGRDAPTYLMRGQFYRVVEMEEAD